MKCVSELIGTSVIGLKVMSRSGTCKILCLCTTFSILFPTHVCLFVCLFPFPRHYHGVPSSVVRSLGHVICSWCVGGQTKTRGEQVLRNIGVFAFGYGRGTVTTVENRYLLDLKPAYRFQAGWSERGGEQKVNRCCWV